MKFNSIAFAISSLFLVSGCNHPIETDLPGVISVERDGFQMAQTIENRSNAYIAAQKLVREKLIKRGYRQDDNGQIYVTVTLSERDASSALSSSIEQGKKMISDATDRGFLKVCDDRAVRLALILHDKKDGNILYNGSATRRRCEFDDATMVKRLVDAAISDLQLR